MKSVVIKFKSPLDVWKFKTTANINNVEVNLKDCLIICNCSNEAVQIAIEKFNAQIIKKEQ